MTPRSAHPRQETALHPAALRQHNDDFDVAPLAALLADRARSAMLRALLDGRRMPAGELARAAGVRPSIASAHLDQLVTGGMLSVEPHGRHRYFRLANESVAHALEALGVAGVLTGPPNRASTACPTGLRAARCCYDHIAGRLGVGMADALAAQAALGRDERGFYLGAAAVARFAVLGVDVVEVRASAALTGRPLVRTCLDWSERRWHVAGALGTALLGGLERVGWIERAPRGRALRITNEGRRRLRRELDIVV